MPKLTALLRLLSASQSAAKSFNCGNLRKNFRSASRAAPMAARTRLRRPRAAWQAITRPDGPVAGLAGRELRRVVPNGRSIANPQFVSVDTMYSEC
ncbi:MAG: hypothetical protein CMJ58_17940 [Planctomycetaceae bacterium]|nr:hypothetical protein [Planctomycetaceae bacterium]